MWVLVFAKYLFAIYVHEVNGSYKIVVNGHKKYFRGETARQDAEQWIRDNDWDVWISLRNHNADW
jgi:hypothetical protein